MTTQRLANAVGVGLLGYGTAGKVFHAPVIAAVPTLQIRAVMTSRRDDVVRDLPGVTAVSDAQAIFDDPQIGLVVVATPNPTHAALAERALRAGKHVVIDKPMTVTLREAERLVDVADECGRLLAVYQNRRWDGDFRTLRLLVEHGKLGTIATYEAHYDRFRPAIKAGWREEPAPGSGLLYDLGSHLIDQVLVLFGMPETVTADVLAQRSEARVDDFFHVVLEYGRMRAIVGASTLVARPGPHFAVHGDGGSFVKYGMDPQEAALKTGARAGGAGWGDDAPDAYGTLVTADGLTHTLPTVPGDYPQFYRDMAAAIERGGPPPVDGRAGRNVIAVIEAALRRARERRTVAVM